VPGSAHLLAKTKLVDSSGNKNLSPGCNKDLSPGYINAKCKPQLQPPTLLPYTK
jgi:hypothetical protein